MITAEERKILRHALGCKTLHEWQRPGWRNHYALDPDQPAAAHVKALADRGMVARVCVYDSGLELWRATRRGCLEVGVSPSDVVGAIV